MQYQTDMTSNGQAAATFRTLLQCAAAKKQGILRRMKRTSPLTDKEFTDRVCRYPIQTKIGGLPFSSVLLVVLLLYSGSATLCISPEGSFSSASLEAKQVQQNILHNDKEPSQDLPVDSVTSLFQRPVGVSPVHDTRASTGPAGGSASPWGAHRSLKGEETDGGASEKAEGNSNTSTSDADAALELMQIWSTMYNLEGAKPPFPEVKPFRGWGPNNSAYLPFAPHLQDCSRLHRVWTAQEARGPNGEDPAWAVEQLPVFIARPPWVAGSDEDNIGGTRYMQTKLWQHQFPANCSDPHHKFLVMDWPAASGHGLGSQIHLMSLLLSYAMKSNRIYVPVPGTYANAQSPLCEGSAFGSLECFFFPLVHPQCGERIKKWVDENKEEIEMHADEELQEAYMSNRTVVFSRTRLTPTKLRMKFYLPDELTHIWNASEQCIEVLGVKPNEDLARRDHAGWSVPSLNSTKTGWWRSQTTRFILRRPQPLLCHMANKMRHDVFGFQLASQVAQVPAAMARAKMRSEMSDDRQGKVPENVFSRESLDMAPIWREAPPAIPRPIVSMHVRQGDKVSEMHIISFAVHMWLAERIRRRHLVSNMWLSSIEKSVIEESNAYKNWNFYYARHDVRVENATMNHNTLERQKGLTRMTIEGFVSILVSSECDYFVGSLGSNWARLLNELRLTGGKLKAGFLTVNFLEQ
eukprot:TRINITY_DN5865_c0_g2_i1.p1 TRINITY_DN5865_c0_g2~~TRINITY_DN5865_c0_g2_i1.p1  ORF type:complete len:692 (-),score=52.69 TRINITY_DN5865_c0_g2_i1:457-2532(-)